MQQEEVYRCLASSFNCIPSWNKVRSFQSNYRDAFGIVLHVMFSGIDKEYRFHSRFLACWIHCKHKEWYSERAAM